MPSLDSLDWNWLLTTPRALPAAFIGGGLLLAAIVQGIAALLERRRSTGIMEAATRSGMSFERQGQPFNGATPSLDLFSQGWRRKFRNLSIRDTPPLRLELFDYRYVRTAGRHTSTYWQTVAACRTSIADLPAFTLAREGLGERLVQKIGFSDIDLEQHPTFSARYALRSDHQQAVRAWFRGEVATSLEALVSDLRIEHDGNWMIAYRPARRSSPAAWDVFAAAASEAFRAILQK